MLESSVRRTTRGQSARDGHKIQPIADLLSRPHKHVKKTSKIPMATKRISMTSSAIDIQEASSSSGFAATEATTPEVPIETMQAIGHILEIDQALLTADKLKASPNADSPATP